MSATSARTPARRPLRRSSRGERPRPRRPAPPRRPHPRPGQRQVFPGPGLGLLIAPSTLRDRGRHRPLPPRGAQPHVDLVKPPLGGLRGQRGDHGLGQPRIIGADGSGRRPSDCSAPRHRRSGSGPGPTRHSAAPPPASPCRAAPRPAPARHRASPRNRQHHRPEAGHHRLGQIGIELARPRRRRSARAGGARPTRKCHSFIQRRAASSRARNPCLGQPPRQIGATGPAPPARAQRSCRRSPHPAPLALRDRYARQFRGVPAMSMIRSTSEGFCLEQREDLHPRRQAGQEAVQRHQRLVGIGARDRRQQARAQAAEDRLGAFGFQAGIGCCQPATMAGRLLGKLGALFGLARGKEAFGQPVGAREPVQKAGAEIGADWPQKAAMRATPSAVAGSAWVWASFTICRRCSTSRWRGRARSAPRRWSGGTQPLAASAASPPSVVRSRKAGSRPAGDQLAGLGKELDLADAAGPSFMLWPST
jgi:hypothetical protein